MHNFFKQFQKNDFIRSLASIFFGLLFLLVPSQTFDILIYIIAAYLAFQGAIDLYYSYQIRRQTGYFDFQFIRGVSFLIAALFVCLFAKALLAVIPLFLGILIVLSGSLRLRDSLNLKNSGLSYINRLIYSVILIIAGIILIFNPFKTILVLLQIFGVLLFIMGLMDIIAVLQAKRQS